MNQQIKLRAVIIDDEERVRDALEGLIHKYCTNVVIVAYAHDVKSGVDAIKKHLPDVVLLDVQMPDGNGFELLKQVSYIPFKLIFITAYQEYAIKAFKYSALDYLLKPVDPEDLVKALGKAEQFIEKESTILRLNSFIENMNALSKERKIVLKTLETIHLVNIQDIIRCESEGSYTCFYFNANKKLVVSKQLKEFDELLNEDGFLRIHKSHLINVAYIDNYKKHQGAITMKDGSSIPVSSRKKEFVLTFIERYAG